MVYENICYCSNELKAVLETVSCDRFILMLTTAVYELHNHTVEEDYKPSCNEGTISLQEIISYVEDKTGKKAQYSLTGDEAPYNGTSEYSIDTKKAKSLGYSFTNLKDWIYELIDFYIDTDEFR